MQFEKIMGVLNKPNGLAEMMQEPAFENEETGHEFSQADLIADVVNILRMDTKRMAEAHDIDIEINQMTPDHAAQLLQGIAKGEDLGLVDIFDQVEDKRMEILLEVEDEQAVEEYQQMKQGLLYTVPDEVAATTEEDHEN